MFPARGRALMFSSGHPRLNLDTFACSRTGLSLIFKELSWLLLATTLPYEGW
jgi:hypothetical protein